jgi:hypothetical protein
VRRADMLHARVCMGISMMLMISVVRCEAFTPASALPEAALQSGTSYVCVGPHCRGRNASGKNPALGALRLQANEVNQQAHAQVYKPHKAKHAVVPFDFPWRARVAEKQVTPPFRTAGAQ